MRPGNLWERSAGDMGEDRNPQSVGPTLKKAREDFGLSHEDVERVTKIRTRYLEAMERDDYDALPGAVYAQGFLKTYANYLDLDGEALSQGLRDRREAPEEPDTDRTEDKRRYRDRAMGAGRPRRGRRRRVPVIALVGAILALIILAAAVTGLYFVGLQATQSSNDPTQTPASADGPNVDESNAEGVDPENEPAPESDDAQSSGDGSSGTPEGQSPDGAADAADAAPEDGAQEAGQQGAEGAGEGEAPVAEPEQPAPEDPVEPPPPESLTMELRVEGNISWLNIESDGEVVFSGVAESGFVRTFEANDSITVWSGNAGAVFISVNGQDYGQLGGSGQTVVREFSLKTAEN